MATPSWRQFGRGATSRAGAGHRRQVEQQLRRAPGEHTPGQRVGDARNAGRRARRRPERRRDQRHVEEHRCERRDREAVGTVEDRAREGGERYQRHVGEHDARQVRGEPEALRIVEESRHEHRRQQPRAGDAGHRHDHQHDDEVAEHRRDECPERSVAAAFTAFGEHGHEGECECRFGEQATEEVRDAECQIEGIRGTGRAHEVRQCGVPGESGEARQRGHAREHAALRRHVAALRAASGGDLVAIAHGWIETCAPKELPRGPVGAGLGAARVGLAPRVATAGAVAHPSGAIGSPRVRSMTTTLSSTIPLDTRHTGPIGLTRLRSVGILRRVRHRPQERFGK